jgi:hypothetical protein
MAVGLKILTVLFAASFLGLGLVVLPAHPATEPAYSCFVTTKECLTSNPMDLMMSKMMPTMSYYRP